MRAGLLREQVRLIAVNLVTGCYNFSIVVRPVLLQNPPELEGWDAVSLEMDAALRYRTHAEELRVIAESDGHFQTQRILISIANDYVRMAETFEQIDRTNQSLHRPKPRV